VAACDGFDYVVAPSGSVSGMIRRHYPDLLADDPAWAARAASVAARTYELVSFLVDVLGLDTIDGRLERTATYHDSCSGLRELGVKEQPRRLIGRVAGLRLAEMENAEICCGFGGTFCVKYPDISDRMVSDKCAAITDTGADLLLAGDLGCLMHMAGKLSRLGRKIEVRHVAEVLDGRLDEPGLCADAAAS
jgi:L-lactate dehydrogenase complex protein LldE